MRNIALALSLSILSLGTLGCSMGGSKKAVATVTFNQTIQPKSTLDERYMRIAVYNADVVADQGSDTFDEKKWRQMAADFVQAELQRAADEHDVPIKLVDRETMKATMGEKDMAAAGITEGSDSMASAALAGAQAVLTSKITIKIDKQSTTEYKSGRSFRGIPLGSGGADTRESRNITVTCQFQLKDAGTNEIVYGYTGKPRRHYQGGGRSNPFWSKSKTEVDMEPRDEIIAQIIEAELQNFMCKFVPVNVSDSTTVEPSGNESSKAGTRALVAEDWETALTNFKAAIAEKENDHESLFGAGVACEKLGRLEEARKYYKLAMSYEDEEEKYGAALNRVEDMMARTQG